MGKEVAQQDWQLYAYCFSRKRASAYERFVQQGMKQESPWAKLKGQICLGDEAFLKHMERLAQGKPSANVPRAHTRTARPTAPTLTQAVLSTYGIKDEKALRSRRHQASFQAWVYWLRRVANLPLREVAKHGNVSPSRISKIQRAIEAQKIPASLQQLLDKCNVKN